MKHNQHRCPGGRIEMVQVHEIAIGCFQLLDPCIVDALASEEFSP
jgi:hypothetical protein